MIFLTGKNVLNETFRPYTINLCIFIASVEINNIIFFIYLLPRYRKTKCLRKEPCTRIMSCIDVIVLDPCATMNLILSKRPDRILKFWI